MKAMLNYSTSVGATRTVSEMQTMLAAHGAASIKIGYASGKPVGIDFEVETPHGFRAFSLPVNVDTMHAVLLSQDKAGLLKTGTKAGRSSREQAERVAWRVMKDWLAAQLALVETEMAGLDQVMLPYLQVDGTKTLYAAYAEREASLAIGARA